MRNNTASTTTAPTMTPVAMANAPFPSTSYAYTGGLILQLWFIGLSLRSTSSYARQYDAYDEKKMRSTRQDRVMKIGILGLGDQYSVGTASAGAAAAAEDGFDAYWLPGEVDPISAIVAIGRQVPGITLATSVVPVFSRHPVALAAEALMTNQAIGGRLILGVGLSHRSIVLTKWGQPFDRPVRYLREYLEILVPLLDTGTVDFQGELLSARTTIRVDGAIRPPVLVAAMGPQT